MYSMLKFLDVYPLAIFAGLKFDPHEADTAFEDVYAAFMAFSTSDDERIRTLTSEVSRNTLTVATMSAWQSKDNPFTVNVKFSFWEST